jgi:TonB-linked SusC/RagA family outer membrane protein
MKKNDPNQRHRRCPLLRKMLNIMKVTTLLFFLALFQVSANSYSQQTRLNLKFENETLESVFSKIEANSEFSIFYKNEMIQNSKEVTAEFKNALIFEILDQVLKTENLSYTVRNKLIMIVPKEEGTNVMNLQQQKSVSGKVTDSSGGSLPGVSVVIKGTTNGVITDIDGKYTISKVPENATLQFSFVGMKGQEIAVGSKYTINITLAEETIGIEEVVAVGYGTQKKESLTGSIASVGGDKLNAAVPAGNAMSRLAGLVTGVTVTTNWLPGSTATVRVRGYGSIRSNDPLYVVDGIPRTSFDNINPNDIESISVLKDASSAAIYGTRAANGVILVTTKRGKEGRGRVSFSAKHGFQFLTKSSMPDLMNSQEYVDNLRQKWTNMGLAVGIAGWGDAQVGYADPRLPDYIFPAGKMTGSVDESTYTPPYALPYNAITKTNKGGNLYGKVWSQGAPTDDYNLNLSGGNVGSNYSISVEYYHQKGLFNYDGDNYNPATNNGYTRYSLRSNSDITVNEWLKISPDISAFYARQDGSTGNGSVAINFNPLLPIYDIKGNFAGSKIPLMGNGVNPVADLVRNKDDYSNQLVVQASTTVQIKFTKDLTFRSLFGANYRVSNTSDRALADPEFNQTLNTAIFTAGANRNFQFNFTNTLNYMKSINNHNINLLLGTESLDQRYEDLSGSRSTFAFQNIDYMILSAGQKDITNAGTIDQNRLFSYFARANYDYKGKYLLEAVLRRDASSRFIGKYRWGTFPAFSAGWRISEEDFLKNSTWINNLKLRLGWGKNGNDNVGNYNAYSTFGGADNRSYYNITGASRSSVSAGFSKVSLGNPDARWETGISTNVGLDVSLFKSKFEGILDVFDRRTKDMLYMDTRPGVWGMVTLPDKNIGEMKNTGYELTLAYNGGEAGSKLIYRVSANISQFKNTVVKLNNNPNEILYGNNTEAGYSTATAAGHPFNSFYGYVFEGFFNTQDEVNAWPKYNPNAAGLDTYSRLGVMKFKDVNKDGVINSLDRTFLGDGYPDLTYGLNASLKYEGWDLNLGVVGIYGRSIINNAQRTIIFIRNDGNYLTKRLYESWTPERYASGAKITVPITINTDANMQLPSSYFISKGDYIQLRDITIGYTLPNKVLSRLKVTNFRVYVQANNLITITKYNGNNPEVNDSGVDNNVYPTPRIFTFGINMDI